MVQVNIILNFFIFLSSSVDKIFDIRVVFLTQNCCLVATMYTSQKCLYSYPIALEAFSDGLSAS